MTERRTSVQAEGRWYLLHGDPRREPWARRAGTVSWEEHERAWRAYADRYGSDQSAERIAERGGFGFREMTALLGHEPRTWEPR